MARLLTGNRTASRAIRGDDFYASPYAALPPLLVAERGKLPKMLWEPAAGNGALVLPLRNRGFSVLATDLKDRGCPDCAGDVDFTSDLAAGYGKILAAHHDRFGIVTNPPFGIIEEFVERAVAMAPYVALLCRLAFLESEGRMRWWQRVGLRRVHLIAERLPMMHRHGYDGPKLSNAGMCFAWFIFESGKRPAHQIPVRWILMEGSLPKASTDGRGHAAGRQGAGRAFRGRRMTGWRQLDLLRSPRQRGTKPPPALERQTQMALKRTLDDYHSLSTGWEWFAIPNGELRTEKTGALLKAMGVKPGVLDLFFISPEGKPHFMEMKRGSAPLTDAQTAFIARMEARHVPCAVARSYEEAIDQLKMWGAVKTSLKVTA